MEKHQTLVVLEEGNRFAFDGPLSCCYDVFGFEL